MLSRLLSDPRARGVGNDGVQIVPEPDMPRRLPYPEIPDNGAIITEPTLAYGMCGSATLSSPSLHE